MKQRPILCRLCQFPVLDTGVPVAELELDKLSRWWELQFETELDDDEDTISSSWICQFCICDARFELEAVCAKEEETFSCEFDWWTTLGVNNIYQQFYNKYEALHPCKVAIAPLPNPTILTKKRRGPIGCPTTCAFCSKRFPSRKSAFAHINLAHQNLKKHKCPHCWDFFKHREDVTTHIEQEHQEFKCHFCQAPKNSLRLLWRHVFKFHRRRSWRKAIQPSVTCCKLVFKTKEMFSAHMQSSLLYRSVKCVYCNGTYDASQVTRHILDRHRARAIKCSQCQFPCFFLNQQQKQLHTRRVHQAGHKLVQCHFCPLWFRERSLAGHVLEFHKHQVVSGSFVGAKNEKPNFHLTTAGKECVYCGEVLKNWKGLYNHVEKVHVPVIPRRSDKGLSKKLFKCSKCKHTTSTLCFLKRHIERIHGIPYLQCQHCPKMFSSPVSLRDHKYARHHIRIGRLKKL